MISGMTGEGYGCGVDRWIDKRALNAYMRIRNRMRYSGKYIPEMSLNIGD